MSPAKIFFSIILGVFFLFFGREFLSTRFIPSAIFVEENAVIIRLQNRIFTFGKTDSDEIKMTIRAVKPYFSIAKVLDLESMEIGKTLSKNGVSVIRISINVVKMSFEGQHIIFINDQISADEREKITATPISFAADLWILRTNFYPDFLPVPNVAIISLSSRISKKVVKFAQGKEIPLISASETGGAMFEFEAGKWRVKIR